MIIEVEEDGDKDIDKLDIEIPVLSPRAIREYKNLNELDLDTLQFQISEYYEYTEEEQRDCL